MSASRAPLIWPFPARPQDDLYQLFSKFGNVSDTFIATGEGGGARRDPKACAGAAARCPRVGGGRLTAAAVREGRWPLQTRGPQVCRAPQCAALQPPPPRRHPAERETGRSRGFGFVTMNSEEANAAANSLNNSDFM